MKKPAGVELAGIIRKAGFRATKPRLLVLAFLHGIEYPASIKEIITGIGREKVDQVTVYRILEAFKAVGLVAQVDFQHGRAYYELKDAAHDHHHIVCTGCDRVEDFTGCDYDKLADKALSQTSGFAKVTNHSLELFGLCNTCVKTA
ncbi:MAG: ferric uptake regulator, Fur family [Candidatus Kaiserbacteria bacterium]|nr:ferric uptake regulator, Fur family [Candidatus Kaiserbacteria bacterium]